MPASAVTGGPAPFLEATKSTVGLPFPTSMFRAFKHADGKEPRRAPVPAERPAPGSKTDDEETPS